LVIGRLALAILRMPALATSAGAIHRVAVAALDRLPALATYAYVHHAPPYRCHGGAVTGAYWTTVLWKAFLVPEPAHCVLHIFSIARVTLPVERQNAKPLPLLSVPLGASK
jgi:hypothetical protein